MFSTRNHLETDMQLPADQASQKSVSLCEYRQLISTSIYILHRSKNYYLSVQCPLNCAVKSLSVLAWLRNSFACALVRALFSLIRPKFQKWFCTKNLLYSVPFYLVTNCDGNENKLQLMGNTQPSSIAYIQANQCAFCASNVQLE